MRKEHEFRRSSMEWSNHGIMSLGIDFRKSPSEHEYLIEIMIEQACGKQVPRGYNDASTCGLAC